MRLSIKKGLYAIGLWICTQGVYAQTLEQAKKLYSEGQYEEAKPTFERLVKQAPGNASYNHWYGVCCLETGDPENAEKYLQVGVKRKVQESYRYMGELYFQTYRFEEAAEMFQEYINILTKKKQDIDPFEARLQTALKAQRMVDRVEDIQIIDSVVVNKNDFLSAYVLSEESGSVSWFKDFFRTNGEVNSTVYMNQKEDNIHYACPTEENGYNIFRQSRLLDQWGDEKELPASINTEADENYPFVLSDGVTIYYASTGNGSIGGYDLFVTRYNTNSETYLTPEHLGMPFNSPANDYMMVVDEQKGLGWFASDRNQPEDKVCLYLYMVNDSRSRIDSEDMDMKRARAAITSIEDSWKPGVDYSELIRLAYTEMPGEPDIQKDFEFIITNHLVYFTLEEIQSPEARNIYEKVVDLNRQIRELNEKLAELRIAYTEGNRARKEQLAASILEAEDQLNRLLEQPDGLERKARNAEINYLKINR